MKIGIFADTHYCELEKLDQKTIPQRREPVRAYSAVKEAFDEFKKQGVDIAVCMGDFVHFNDGIEESVKHLEKISKLINSYNIPTYQCMGNHDNEVISPENFAEITGFHVAPTVAEDDRVRLVFLDASYYPDGTHYGRVDVDWTSSFVPGEELEWLDNQLTTDKKTLVFIHQNIDTNLDSKHIVSNADEINAVIAKHKVNHVYQGHFHLGAENIINSIPYTTVRAMCITGELNYIITEV